MNELNCDDALAWLYDFLGQELDEHKRAEIGQHLDACHHCLEAFEFEAELRRVIATRSAQRCPDELRARIAMQLGTEPTRRR